MGRGIAERRVFWVKKSRRPTEFGNRKFSIFGRDDRQLLATELALRQKYEYSNPLSREIDVTQLHRGIELIAFEVPSIV
jgi:hypothetical protein